MKATDAATIKRCGLEAEPWNSGVVSEDLLLRLALRGKLVREDRVGVVLKQ